MDHQAFIGAIRHFTGRRIAITFNPDANGITALSRLYRAYTGPGKPLKIDPNDEIVVEAICLARRWDNDKNRTVKFVGLEGLDDETLYQFSRDIEKIAV
jgi:hypothetical protein